MDGADLELFERTLRHVTESHSGEALDAALAELGWQDALATDPRAAVSTLFELQGEANAASSALDHVVTRLLGLGSTVGAVLPALDRWDPPGELVGEHVRVDGLGCAALANRETAVVVIRTAEKNVAMSATTGELALRSVQGLDPDHGLMQVTGEAVATEIGPVDWRAVTARAQLAVGHELVGAARRMLELARDHALERIQFGRPISTFQAVRHRLADALVAIETAGALLDAAWEDASPQTAAMAKALAGRGARTTARHCQQVLAGIGFTTEHPLHRYVRRVLVLDQLLGSNRALTRELGTDLLASRQLPARFPL